MFKNKLFLLIFTPLFLIGVLSAAYFFIEWQIIRGPAGPVFEKDFTILPNEGARRIGEHLKREKLISSDFYFLFYLWERGMLNKLQAGEYALKSDMSIKEIASKFLLGETKPNWIEVTIPEGFTLKKIDARFAAAGLIQSGELINFNSSDFSRFARSGEARQLKNLEGYLFPDTYRLDKDATIEEIVQKMLNNFEEKVSPLLGDINKSGKTLEQIVIMASILEKEVKTDEDWKIASGIFWKRLKAGWKLEADSTIAYILGIDKWHYSLEEAKTSSPYNTYLNKGLPPGPINNPGLATIRAAIYPVETNYYFFLTDPATEKTIYGRTLEEHNRNKAKYFK